MKNYLNAIINNWHTTGLGLILIISGLVAIFKFNKDWTISGGLMVMGLGLVHAKDAHQSELKK